MSNSSQYYLMQNESEEPVNDFQNSCLKYCTGEIQHTHYLAEQIGQLLMNDHCSDVTLIVEDTHIPAHKTILAARSNYFWAMFYGGMKESTLTKIYLKDVPLQAFKILLKYIYYGRIQLHLLSFDIVIDVLSLVHKYGFMELETSISDYLKSALNQQTVCSIYSAAHLYSMKDLENTCLDFFDSYASETLKIPNFLLLNASTIAQIIGRSSFCAPEIEIFNAVRKWIETYPDKRLEHQKILNQVRLPLIKFDHLLSIVRPSGLVDSDVLLDALTDQSKKRSSDLVYRGFLIPNENIASTNYNAKVINGNFSSDLLTSNNDCTSPIRSSFARHNINNNDPGIVVELGRCFIINYIQLLLFDRDQQMYSYFVEISVDQKDWIKVADYTNYLCQARQKIYFHERVVKYIRVVGTYNSNTAQGTFNLSQLKAFYTTEPFEVDPVTTLLIPKYNVATIPNNAMVIEGVSRSRNALLNGDTKNYDWDNGYTCHELGSSSIIVQLPQPYLVDSMRLLLWDCDNRTYSFYIEVSCDRTNWTKVVEVHKKSSWQLLRFERIPVVFIKIVGTFNSANEVFHCVHFECPTNVTEEDLLQESLKILNNNKEGSVENEKKSEEEKIANKKLSSEEPVKESLFTNLNLTINSSILNSNNNELVSSKKELNNENKVEKNCNL